MPKIKIDYGNMIFYKVYCINPAIKKNIYRSYDEYGAEKTCVEKTIGNSIFRNV